MDSKINIASWKVIVADQDARTVELIQDMLDEAGAAGYWAHTVFDVFWLLDEIGRPEVVLVDVRLPFAQSHFMKYLYQCEGMIDLVVIAMTSRFLAHEAKEFLDLGFNGYFGKPPKNRMFLDDLARIGKQLNERRIHD